MLKTLDAGEETGRLQVSRYEGRQVYILVSKQKSFWEERVGEFV